MNTFFNEILPLGLIIGGLFALWMTFSKPVSLLPRWVRYGHLLLSASMIAWGIIRYFKIHAHPSEHTQSLLLQIEAWCTGFSTAILIMLMLTGAFPRIFSSRPAPPAR